MSLRKRRCQLTSAYTTRRYHGQRMKRNGLTHQVHLFFFLTRAPTRKRGALLLQAGVEQSQLPYRLAAVIFKIADIRQSGSSGMSRTNELKNRCDESRFMIPNEFWAHFGYNFCDCWQMIGHWGAISMVEVSAGAMIAAKLEDDFVSKDRRLDACTISLKP